MPASDTAVLVIDAQESFRYRPYWSEADLPAFVAGVQSLVDGAKARGIPVVQIFHVEESGPFSLASGQSTAGGSGLQSLESHAPGYGACGRTRGLRVGAPVTACVGKSERHTSEGGSGRGPERRGMAGGPLHA